MTVSAEGQMALLAASYEVWERIATSYFGSNRVAFARLTHDIVARREPETLAARMTRKSSSAVRMPIQV